MYIVNRTRAVRPLYDGVCLHPSLYGRALVALNGGTKRFVNGAILTAPPISYSATDEIFTPDSLYFPNSDSPSATNWYLTLPAQITRYSIIAVIRRSRASTGGLYRSIVGGRYDGYYFMGLTFTPTDKLAYTYSGGGTPADVLTSTASFADTNIHTVGVSDFSTSSALYADGKKLVSGGGGSNGIINFCYGYQKLSSNAGKFEGNILALFLFSSPLLETEMLKYTANPWSMFAAAPAQRRIFTFSAGGGTSFVEITPAGGIDFAGSATPTRNVVPPATGLLDLGGAAVIDTFVNTNSVDITPSGGISFDGLGVYSRSVLPVLSGGMDFSGTATPSSAVVPAVSGGLSFAGDAPVIRSFNAVPTGGIDFASEAIPVRTSIPEPSGGVVFAGDAGISSSQFQVLTVTPTGGIDFSGIVTLNSTRIVIPVGGYVFGSSADISVFVAAAAATGVKDRMRLRTQKAYSIKD